MTERKTFGGLAFLLHGNMCCGKPLRSMVYVGAADLKSKKSLAGWVEQTLEFA